MAKLYAIVRRKRTNNKVTTCFTDGDDIKKFASPDKSKVDAQLKDLTKQFDSRCEYAIVEFEGDEK